MTELPFQFSIKRAGPGGKIESLMCRTLLRIIPGRREVYRASWNGRAVIAKLFSHKISARRHTKRDWRGLCLLRSRRLNSPEPLFYGRTEDGRWAIVIEEIADASTVIDVFYETAEPAGRLDLLKLVSRELARQHETGVLQKDLHLGNFLLQKEKVFSLDPAEMRFLSHPVGKRQAIWQLASLAATLPEEDTEGISCLCTEYSGVRSWRLTKADMKMLFRKVTAHRKRNVKKALKKCLRTGKRYVKLRRRVHNAVAARDFFERVDFSNLLEKIDLLMQNGKILKNGNTCFVARINLAGQQVVVKRYNYKGFIHSLRHTIKKSRARGGWLHAHRLAMLNVTTPRALAYIEQRKGLVLRSLYLVTEYVEGQNLYNFLRAGDTTKQQRQQVTQQLRQMLDKLSKNRIVHGDLKHSNILVRDGQVVLTDLDAMKVHKLRWLFKIRQAKDVKHFVGKGQITGL